MGNESTNASKSLHARLRRKKRMMKFTCILGLLAVAVSGAKQDHKFPTYSPRGANGFDQNGLTTLVGWARALPFMSQNSEPFWMEENNVRIEVLKEDLQGVTVTKKNFLQVYQTFKYQVKVIVNDQVQVSQGGLLEANLAGKLDEISNQHSMKGPR